MELANALDFARKHPRGVLVTARRDGRAQLSNVATRLRLPADEVDLVVSAGTDAVLQHPALRRRFTRATPAVRP